MENKESHFDVTAKEPTIAFDGTIAGAEWDATNKTCRISVNGTFTSPQDRHDTKEGEAYDIVSERYDQSGCEAIAAEKGSFFTIDRLKVIDDGKGGTILSDSDKEATAALFKDETDYRNYKEQKYTEGVLNYTNYKPEYQENLSYSCVPQTINPINVNAGATEPDSWPGYSVCLEHGVPVLRDSNGVAVTATQAAEEARFVCEKTGDKDACNAVRIDACSANHDPEKLDMICAFDKNGKETLISGEGFTRESLEAAGNISKKSAEEAAVRNTAKSGDLLGTFRSQTKSIASIIKDIFGTDRKVTVAEISEDDKTVGDEQKELTKKAADGDTNAENNHKSNGKNQEAIPDNGATEAFNKAIKGAANVASDAVNNAGAGTGASNIAGAVSQDGTKIRKNGIGEAIAIQ